MSPCILFVYAPLSTSASRGNILGGMVNGARYGFASKGDVILFYYLFNFILFFIKHNYIDI